MMDARVLLALAALVVVALVYVSAGVQSALAPLCAAATTALWFTVMGCLDLLVAGGWAFYLLCALGVGWLVWRHVLKKHLLPRLGFGFWFFVAASLCAIALLWARQPMFTTWDEFSLWGTADKLVKLYDELYTTAPVGWAWPATASPALPVFGYFVQFFGGGFSEWQTYVARDIFQLAALSALLAPFAKRHWDTALPAALAGLLAPFVFSQYATAAQLSPAWMDTLADLPLGLWFFGALAAWYTSNRRWRDMLPVCLALAVLTLIKETGLAFALVAAAIIFFDAALDRRAREVTRLRHTGQAAGRFALAAGTIVAAYQGWSLYLSAAIGVDRTANVGGARQMSMLEMPLAFIQELFSSNKSERFQEMLDGLWRIFVTDKVTGLGTGLVTVACILAVVALAAVLARNPVHRRRCVVFGVFSTVGFAVYRLFIGMTYVYVFRVEQMFEGDRRYMMPYYLGWFLSALLLLCIGVGRAAPQPAGKARPRVVLAKAGVLALAAAMLLRVVLLFPIGYTVVGVSSAEFGHRRVFAQKVQALQQQLPPDGKSFVVLSDNSGGLEWFKYCYQMLPWQVDYSYGGGELCTVELQPDGTRLITVVTAEMLQQRLIAEGCTTMILDNIDDTFRERYGALFADGLAAFDAGETQIYDVNVQGDAVRLTPRPAGDASGEGAA